MYDKVGDGIAAARGDWSFGGSVAETFDSHVERSVPLYREGHQLICELSDFFVKSGSRTLEVGCSTGTLTLALAEFNRHKRDCVFVGIDVEDAMIKLARSRFENSDLASVEFCVGDALDYDFGTNDLILSYYTLQFIAPAVRQLIVDKIYRSLNWGGAFVLYEKVRGPDARFQDILTSLYQDYKTNRGFSSDEIIAKARSLKGILEPFSSGANREMLERAGFRDVMPIQRFICFEGLLAIK